MRCDQLVLAALGFLGGMGLAAAADAPADPITHSFFAAGNETYILDGAGKRTWRYPLGSRDGWVLADGNVLLALSKHKDMPGGGVVEVTRDGKVVREFKGTQSEVNTVQPLDGGRVLLSEAGNQPRLLDFLTITLQCSGVERPYRDRPFPHQAFGLSFRA